MAISFEFGPSETSAPESPIAVRPQAAEPAALRSDASLISAIISGDRAALADLYDRYVDTLLSLAQRIFGHRAPAEDLVHDVFLEVWQTATSYAAERGSVRTWLLLRTRCRALDRVRSGAWRELHKGALIDTLVNAAQSPGGSGELSWQVTRDQLRLAMRVLSDEERELLKQIYGCGMPLGEVAQRLNLPLGTLKSRLKRLLEKLRAYLNRYPDEA